MESGVIEYLICMVDWRELRLKEEEKDLPVCFWRRLRAIAEESDRAVKRNEELEILRRPEMGS